MADLPPDLARLGDDLLVAARRNATRRERRRRVALAVSIGALAFAALTPAALGPAQRQITIAETAAGLGRPACEHPRGARFTMVAACQRAMVLHHPKPWY